MIVARAAMLLGAVLIALVAVGAGRDLPPSALRMTTGSMIALLAPLFWPGSTAERRATAWRILLWTAAASSIAAMSPLLLGAARPLSTALLRSSAMLAALLLTSHVLVACLERRWARHRGDAREAREQAGRTVTLVLALLGSLPLWIGPMAELLSARHAWAIDAALAVSPLTHLAVAAGSDVLRTPWLYQHSNLARLQSDYPGLPGLAGFYAALCLLLAVLATTMRRRRIAGPTTSSEPTENPQ